MWGSTPINTFAIKRSPSVVDPMRSRDRICYYELGSQSLWSHASTRRPAPRKPIESHTNDLVGSRVESIPPSAWTESGRPLVLTESSSSRERVAGGSSRELGQTASR